MIHNHANNEPDNDAIDSEVTVTVMTRNYDLDDFDNDFAEIILINLKMDKHGFNDEDDEDDEDDDDDDDDYYYYYYYYHDGDDDDDDDSGPFFLPAGHPSRHGGRGVHGHLFSTTPFSTSFRPSSALSGGSYSSKFPWFRGQRS